MKRVGGLWGGLDGNEVEELEMNSIKLNGLDFPEIVLGMKCIIGKEAKKKGYFLIEIRSRLYWFRLKMI